MKNFGNLIYLNVSVCFSNYILCTCGSVTLPVWDFLAWINTIQVVQRLKMTWRDVTYSVFRTLPINVTSPFSVTSGKVLWSHYGYSAYVKDLSWKLNLYSHLPIVIHSLFWVSTLVINSFLVHSWYLQCFHMEREVFNKRHILLYFVLYGKQILKN